MSTVLRASGADFAVDDFLTASKLTPISIFRKGEPRFPASQPDGQRFVRSGANFLVSDAEFEDLALQIEESLAFLREFKLEIRALRQFPGLELLSLDFAVDTHPPHWSSFSFPFELLVAAGELEMDLDLSVYPSDDNCA